MNLSLALLELLWQPQVIPLRGQVEASCGIIITMMRFSIVVVGFFDSSNRVEIDVLACQNVRLRLTPSTVSCWWCCLLVLLFNLDHSKNSLDRLSVHLIVSHQMIRLLVNGDGMEAEWWSFIHTQIVMISGAPNTRAWVQIMSVRVYVYLFIFSRVAKTCTSFMRNKRRS